MYTYIYIYTCEGKADNVQILDQAFAIVCLTEVFYTMHAIPNAP